MQPIPIQHEQPVIKKVLLKENINNKQNVASF